MPGFSGATGVPLKQMQDAIAQSTAKFGPMQYIWQGSLTSAATELDMSASPFVGNGVYMIVCRNNGFALVTKWGSSINANVISTGAANLAITVNYPKISITASGTVLGTIYKLDNA